MIFPNDEIDNIQRPEFFKTKKKINIQILKHIFLIINLKIKLIIIIPESKLPNFLFCLIFWFHHKDQ